MAPAFGSWIRRLLGRALPTDTPPNSATSPPLTTAPFQSPEINTDTPHEASPEPRRSIRSSSPIKNEQESTPTRWSGRLRNGNVLPESPDSLQRSYEILEAIHIPSRQSRSQAEASALRKALRSASAPGTAENSPARLSSSPPHRHHRTLRQSHQASKTPEVLKLRRRRIRRIPQSSSPQARKSPPLVNIRNETLPGISSISTPPASVLVEGSDSIVSVAHQSTIERTLVPPSRVGSSKDHETSSPEGSRKSPTIDAGSDYLLKSSDASPHAIGPAYPRDFEMDSQRSASVETAGNGDSQAILSSVGNPFRPVPQSVTISMPQPKASEMPLQAQPQTLLDQSQPSFKSGGSSITNAEEQTAPESGSGPGPKRRKLLVKCREPHPVPEDLNLQAPASLSAQTTSDPMNFPRPKLASSTFKQNLLAHMIAQKSRVSPNSESPNKEVLEARQVNRPSTSPHREVHESRQVKRSLSDFEVTVPKSNNITTPTDLHPSPASSTEKLTSLRFTAGQEKSSRSNLPASSEITRSQKKLSGAVDGLVRPNPSILTTRVSEAVIGELVAPDTDQSSDASSDEYPSLQISPQIRRCPDSPFLHDNVISHRDSLDGPTSFTESVILNPGVAQHDGEMKSVPFSRHFHDDNHTLESHMPIRSAFNPDSEPIYVLDTTLDSSPSESRPQGPAQREVEDFPFYSVKEEDAPMPLFFTRVPEPILAETSGMCSSRTISMDILRPLPSSYGLGAPTPQAQESLFVPQTPSRSLSPVSNHVRESAASIENMKLAQESVIGSDCTFIPIRHRHTEGFLKCPSDPPQKRVIGETAASQEGRNVHEYRPTGPKVVGLQHPCSNERAPRAKSQGTTLLVFAERPQTSSSARPRPSIKDRLAWFLQVQLVPHQRPAEFAQDTRESNATRHHIPNSYSPQHATHKVPDRTHSAKFKSSPSRNPSHFRGMQNAPVVYRNGKRTIAFDTLRYLKSTLPANTSLPPILNSVLTNSRAQEPQTSEKQAHLDLLFSSPPVVYTSKLNPSERLIASDLMPSPRNDLADA